MFDIFNQSCAMRCLFSLHFYTVDLITVERIIKYYKLTPCSVVNINMAEENAELFCRRLPCFNHTLEIVCHLFLVLTSDIYQTSVRVVMINNKNVSDPVMIPVNSPPNNSSSGQQLFPQQPTGQDCTNV